MDEHLKYKIRGNLDEFLHTGALIMVIFWFMLAAVIFVLAKGQPKQIEIQKFIAGLFMFFLIVPATGILLQTIEINGKYLICPSDIFPIFRRKVLISDIASIGFGRKVTPVSYTVGYNVYDKNDQVVGGIYTKVFTQGDINTLFQKLKEINPNIKIF